MSFSRVLGGTVLIASLGLSTGCATSPKPETAAPGTPGSIQGAPSPQAASQGEPEPQTLSEAEAQLEQARAELDQLALNEPGLAAAADAATAPAPSPVAPARKERADEAAQQAPAAKAGDACDAACRAFSSLTRASDAVCRLDANGGKRCERARQIRDGASQRVARCGCAR